MSANPKKPFIGGLVEGSIDVNVYHDVLKTYAKETVSFINYGNLGITTVNPKKINRVEFTECEISPFRKNEIDCATTQSSRFSRQSSLAQFTKQKIRLSDLTAFLVHAFSPNANNTRPYPSAGALYPVEPLVFMFKERVEGFEQEEGCYHYRPISQKLQLIKKMDQGYFIKKLLHQYINADTAPCFVILYMAHVGKAIFKYRYRGYRHALMEAGSMYQQASMVSQDLGLRNTVWCTFSETEFLTALELDYGTYMPLAMQFFGYGKAHD